MTEHANYQGKKELLGLTLGKTTAYQVHYAPELLQAVPRSLNRDELKLKTELPFTGVDIWNMYELSWLNAKGKPVVATGIATFSCTSINLVESKSFKLYLNSFNQTQFSSMAEVKKVLEKDLAQCAQGEVSVELSSVGSASAVISTFEGALIDDLDINIDQYEFNPLLLQGAVLQDDEIIEQTLVSHLLKSNCLVTQQPDWASIQISYSGRAINQEKLLRYIISFRQHNEFHEQCVERIFMDIMHFCKPESLSVYARYTRRGGLDINPLRSNFNATVDNIRLVRQ